MGGRPNAVEATRARIGGARFVRDLSVGGTGDEGRGAPEGARERTW